MANTDTNQPKAAPAATPTTPEKDALSLIGDLLQQQKEIKSGYDADDDQKWQYVYMCGRGHIALFFRKNPREGLCRPNDWCATYKPTYEAPWRDHVLCQECSSFDADNYPIHEHPVQVSYQRAPTRASVHFVPLTTFVYRYPKDAELRKTIPLHRAAVSDITAANYGVPNPDFPARVRKPVSRASEGA